MTVFANREGELVNFKYYDAAGDEVQTLVENIPFRINDVIGNIEDPKILNLLSTSNVDIILSDVGLRIYPNPTSSRIFLNFDIKKEESISVRIFNALGQLTDSRLINVQAGNNNLDYSFPQGTVVGQYIIELKTTEKLYKQKIEFVK